MTRGISALHRASAWHHDTPDFAPKMRSEIERGGHRHAPVPRALRPAEDVGAIGPRPWAESLCSVAHVLAREPAVLCGTRWFDHVFQTLDPSVRIERRKQEGDEIEAGHALCPLSGSARASGQSRDGCFTAYPS
jgi:hypothetical protein